MTPRRFLDSAALWGTAGLVTAAVLLLASVSYTGRYLIQCGAAVLGVVWCLRLMMRSRGGWPRRPTSTAGLAGAVLVALLLVPLLPLPPMLIRALSPSGFAVMQTALPGWPEHPPFGAVVEAIEMASPLPGAGAWRPLSLVPWDTLSALSIGAAYVLVGALVALYPWRESTAALRRFTGLLTGLALLLALYGYLQASAGYGRIFWFECYRPVCMGTYSNKDHFAGFVEMVFPLALASTLAWWEQARRDPVVRARRQGIVLRLADYGRLLSHPVVARTVIAGAVAFLLLVALAVSGSRSGFLATFATLAVMLPLLPPRPSEGHGPARERWRDRWFGPWRTSAQRRRRRMQRGSAPRHSSAGAAARPPAPEPGADVWTGPSEDIVYEYPLRNGFRAGSEGGRSLPAVGTGSAAKVTPPQRDFQAVPERGAWREVEEPLDAAVMPEQGSPANAERVDVPDPPPAGAAPGSARRPRPARVSVVFAAVVVFYLTFPQIFPRLWEGELARHWLTLDTLNLAVQYPLFGTGLGTFAAVFPLYKPYTFAAYEFGIPAAHNDYVQWLAEAGLPAAVLAAALLGTFGIRVYRALRGATRRSPEALLRWGLAAGVFAMLVHSFTDFNLHRAANALVFAVLVGALFRLTQPGKSRVPGRDPEVPDPAPGPQYVSSRPSGLDFRLWTTRAALGAAAVGCLLWASWTWTNWSAAAAYHAVYPDTWFKNLAETAPPLPDAERIERMRRAVALAPAVPAYQAGLAEQLRAVAVDEEVGPRFDAATFDESIQASLRSLWENPVQPEVLFGLVQVIAPVYEPDPGTEPGVLYDLVGRTTTLAPFDPRLQFAAARWYLDVWRELPEQTRAEATARTEAALAAASRSPALQADVGVAQAAFRRVRGNG